jgi:hypothetical protein
LLALLTADAIRRRSLLNRCKRCTGFVSRRCYCARFPLSWRCRLAAALGASLLPCRCCAARGRLLLLLLAGLASGRGGTGRLPQPLLLLLLLLQQLLEQLLRGPATTKQVLKNGTHACCSACWLLRLGLGLRRLLLRRLLGSSRGSHCIHQALQLRSNWPRLRLLRRLLRLLRRLLGGLLRLLLLWLRLLLLRRLGWLRCLSSGRLLLLLSHASLLHQL